MSDDKFIFTVSSKEPAACAHCGKPGCNAIKLSVNKLYIFCRECIVELIEQGLRTFEYPDTETSFS